MGSMAPEANNNEEVVANLNQRDKRRLGHHREEGYVPYEKTKDVIPEDKKASVKWKRGPNPSSTDKVLLGCCDEDFIASSFKAQVISCCVVGHTVWLAQVNDMIPGNHHVIMIRDNETGSVIDQIDMPADQRISTLKPVFGRNPNEVWVGMTSGLIAVHGVQHTPCFKEIRHHTGAVTCIEAEKDGECIWTGSTDFSIAVWDLKGRHLWDLKGHLGAINFILPMGPRCWTGAQDGCVRVWSNGSKECMAELPEAHARPTEGSGNLEAYERQRLKFLLEKSGSPKAATAVGNHVWVGYDTGMIRVWKPNHQLECEIEDTEPEIRRISSMQIMGANVWVAGQAEEIYVYDIATRRRNQMTNPS